MVALLWLKAPWWLFFAVALYCYAVPLFQHAYLTAPFVVFLAVAYVEDPSLPAALMLGGIFFLLLGVRDIVFAARVVAYEILTLLLFLWSAFLIFGALQGRTVPVSLLGVTLVAALAAVLLRRLLRYAGSVPSPLEFRVTLGVIGFIIWQAGAAAVLLPLAPLAQAFFVFAVAAFLGEVFLGRDRGQFSWMRLADEIAVLFLALAVILGAAVWRL